MEEIIFSVLMLFQVSGNSVKGTATGFFYEHNDKLYIITNRHVVEFSTKEADAKLIFKVHQDSLDMTKQLSVTIPLNEKGKVKWYGYSDSSIDVVAIPVEKSLFANCIIFPLGLKNFPPKNLLLGIGEELFAVGYPRGFTDQKNLTPIVKTTVVSTPPEIPFEGKPMMLLDGNLLPGMSGSPIITKPSKMRNIERGFSVSNKKEFYLIGIHSASFSKTIGMKKEPIYIVKDGQIQISGFTDVPVEEKLGLQTCIFNGVIEGLVSQIK